MENQLFGGMICQQYGAAFAVGHLNGNLKGFYNQLIEREVFVQCARYSYCGLKLTFTA